jgi:predicted DNA repair protein MutK
MRASILAAVGISITVAVYGAVALIVKADDAGMVLARSRAGVLRVLGRTVVLGMPVFLKGLGIVGTAAMVWVGGGIFIHGLEEFGIAWPAHAAHALADLAAGAPVMAGLLGWFAGALAAGVFGLVLGALCIPVAHYMIGPVARGIGGALKRG